MKTSNFDYNLPDELIAQEPCAVRDECRLLVLNRETGAIEDRIFKDIANYLHPGDLLVANETRVLPARLIGRKRETGGVAEVFLLRPVQAKESNQVAYWEALVKPGKRLKPSGRLQPDKRLKPNCQGAPNPVVDFEDSAGKVALSAEIVDWGKGSGEQQFGCNASGQRGENSQRGERIVRLTTTLSSLDEALHAVGNTPLPPYIKNYTGDKELYQTVYSRRESSAAAPTAGLHFTPELISQLKASGIGWETVELEVGLDTFRIVDEENAEDHAMHTEFYSVPERTVLAIESTKRNGGRVIAVGTTTVRSLESAWDAAADCLQPRQRAATSLYLLPGSKFHVVDALITNFHIPRSTLMMLVSAFAGRDKIMRAYEHAVAKRYRFLSFGDAMFIE